jgi:hypothetical protein
VGAFVVEAPPPERVVLTTTGRPWPDPVLAQVHGVDARALLDDGTAGAGVVVVRAADSL